MALYFWFYLLLCTIEMQMRQTFVFNYHDIYLFVSLFVFGFDLFINYVFNKRNNTALYKNAINISCGTC